MVLVPTTNVKKRNACRRFLKSVIKFGRKNNARAIRVTHRLKYKIKFNARSAFAIMGKAMISKAIDIIPVAITMAKFAGCKFFIPFLMMTAQRFIIGLVMVLVELLKLEIMNHSDTK